VVFPRDTRRKLRTIVNVAREYNLLRLKVRFRFYGDNLLYAYTYVTRNVLKLFLRIGRMTIDSIYLHDTHSTSCNCQCEESGLAMFGKEIGEGFLLLVQC